MPWCHPCRPLVALRLHRGYCLPLPPTLFFPLSQCCVSETFFWASRIRILPSSSKKSKKTLNFYCFVISSWLLSWKTDVNVPSKSNEQKNLLKNEFFGILKAINEKSRFRIQIIKSEVTKMSRIHNTAVAVLPLPSPATLAWTAISFLTFYGVGTTWTAFWLSEHQTAVNLPNLCFFLCTYPSLILGDDRKGYTHDLT